MPSLSKPAPFEIGSSSGAGGERRIAGEASGDGPPVVLLHGLTATRRYVVLGSRLLERSGHRVIAYDAAGHGSSAPAPARAYGYPDQVADLEAVLRFAGADRPVLVGNSMGAHAALGFALREPGRIAALVLITPAYDGAPRSDLDALGRWDALADALERDGVEGFLRVYEPEARGRWAQKVLDFTRQRLERHEHPSAVADALRVVPRSAAFDGLEPLRELDVPALVVGSRDDADPGHPLTVAKAYVDRLPRGELVVEKEGESPLAWRGAQLSRVIVDFLRRSTSCAGPGAGEQAAQP